MRSLSGLFFFGGVRGGLFSFREKKKALPAKNPQKSKKRHISHGSGIYRIMGYFDDRSVILGKYIAETGDTVRGAAKKYGMAKSTVHKLVTGRLPGVDAVLAERVRAVLERNLAERHLRGGEATRRKYLGPQAPQTGNGAG